MQVALAFSQKTTTFTRDQLQTALCVSFKHSISVNGNPAVNATHLITFRKTTYNITNINCSKWNRAGSREKTRNHQPSEYIVQLRCKFNIIWTTGQYWIILVLRKHQTIPPAGFFEDFDHLLRMQTKPINILKGGKLINAADKFQQHLNQLRFSDKIATSSISGQKRFLFIDVLTKVLWLNKILR